MTLRVFGIASGFLLLVSACWTSGGSDLMCLNKDIVVPAEVMDRPPLNRSEFARIGLGAAVLDLYQEGGLFEETPELLEEANGFAVVDDSLALFFSDEEAFAAIEMNETGGAYELVRVSSCTLVRATAHEDSVVSTFEVIGDPSESDSTFQIRSVHEKCDNRSDNPGFAAVEVNESGEAVEVAVWLEPFDPPLLGCTLVGNEIVYTVELVEPLGSRVIVDGQTAPPSIVWP